MVTTMHLRSVTARAQDSVRVLYRIIGADGETYATSESWTAALCQRAIDLQVPVRMAWSRGWHYRTIDTVRLAEKEQAAS